MHNITAVHNHLRSTEKDAKNCSNKNMQNSESSFAQGNRFSLLRGILTNDKGKLIYWVDSLESLQLFVKLLQNNTVMATTLHQVKFSLGGKYKGLLCMLLICNRMVSREIWLKQALVNFLCF